MPETYTKEQLEKLFDQLPEELQEAVFSLETSENILNACRTYGVLTEGVSQIADFVGQVLMGLLPPSDFQKTIQGKVGLPEVLAKGITKEINRFVFYPLRPALEELYKIEITPPIKTEGEKEPAAARSPADKEEKAPPRKDIYRELIED